MNISPLTLVTLTYLFKSDELSIEQLQGKIAEQIEEITKK